MPWRQRCRSPEGSRLSSHRLRSTAVEVKRPCPRVPTARGVGGAQDVEPDAGPSTPSSDATADPAVFTALENIELPAVSITTDGTRV